MKLVPAFVLLLLLSPPFLAYGFQSTSTDPAKQLEYQNFALNPSNGDAEKGKTLFQNTSKPGCATCHSVDGSNRAVGPDLNSVGDKFDRAGLIHSILHPSATIAIGFSTSIVVTSDGEIHQGVMNRVTDEWIELRNAENKTVRIQANEFESVKSSEVSLMPSGIENQMTAAEFADVVQYLSTLHQKNLQTSSGVIDQISKATSPVQLVPFFQNAIRFDHPVWFGEIPSTESTFVVLEQSGKAFVLDTGRETDSRNLLFDLSNSVRGHGATGLLGLAFHPDINSNRRYFIKYQIESNGRVISCIDERRMVANAWKDDSSFTPIRLLSIAGSTPDHNGGCLGFGPDRMLYIGMGDSGPQRDPQGHGQSLKTHLGKLLRIDVDQTSEGLPYGIPSDNPFVSVPDAKPEIWALGFREPWRFSFDSQTKDLWVGDVGQDRFEEVAMVQAGENHGWNVFEGSEPFSEEYRRATEKYVAPIFTYPRRLGVSITGGHVYRGKENSKLEGWYICGDFESRRIWGLREKDRKLQDVIELGIAPSRIVSFAENRHGDIFLIGFDNGIIYRMGFADVDLKPIQTRVLADTSELAPVPWKYALTQPADAWKEPTFNDESWKVGPGGFGTRGTPGSIVRTDWSSRNIWLRRTFEIPVDVKVTSAARLLIHHDEDAIVYLNGVEAANLPRWTSGYVEVPIRPEAIAALHPGTNLMAIECRQNSGGQYIDAGLIDIIDAAPYETRDVLGWKLHILKELLNADARMPTERAVELLEKQLAEIIRVVPESAVGELKKVPLYFSPEYPKTRPAAEFHPDAGWLKKNNRDPGMAQGVEFTNIRIFEEETIRMPNFALHELAHGYHFRFLPSGFDHAKIKAAFESAKKSGKYDSVERWYGNGRANAKEKAYAMSNPMEYFAECSEAFFSRNDFFPFTREELERHDPEMFQLLKEIWQSP